VSTALGAIFGGITRARAAAYRRGILTTHRLAGPVVSVGNIGVGGSGKTPLVRYVAERLLAARRDVAVLSRGYGGRFRGDALVVSDGQRVLADAEAAGDEPVMLARALPGVVVAVGPRRDVVGRAVEERFGPRVHVLDDGFQHLRLARDLDLVCLDVRDLEDRPLPAGRLREDPSALARADLVLLTRLEAASEEEQAALERRLGPERTHRVVREVMGWTDLEGKDAPSPARALLFAGIARPGRFAHDVKQSGTAVVGDALFPDHHRYSADEVEALSRRARDAGADALATTEKDAARLLALGPVRTERPVLVLRVRARVRDEERFLARLLAAVGGAS